MTFFLKKPENIFILKHTTTFLIKLFLDEKIVSIYTFKLVLIMVNYLNVKSDFYSLVIENLMLWYSYDIINWKNIKIMSLHIRIVWQKYYDIS